MQYLRNALLNQYSPSLARVPLAKPVYLCARARLKLGRSPHCGASRQGGRARAARATGLCRLNKRPTRARAARATGLCRLSKGTHSTKLSQILWSPPIMQLGSTRVCQTLSGPLPPHRGGLTGDARLEFLRNENGARGPVGYQPTKGRSIH